MPAARDATRRRHEALLEILRTRDVTRQSELVELLQSRGIAATQSSVSRDLKQLRIGKQGEHYAIEAPVKVEEANLAEVGGLVRSCQTAGANLVVLRTAIGAAQRVGVFLDRVSWPEVVGTVCGDDTLFIATATGVQQQKLVRRLRTNFDV